MSKDTKKTFWEKERRGHLKEAFMKLEKLLPSYDPSNATSRIGVITKSIEYIEEMRNIIQELLKPHSEVNPKVFKLKNLQDRIKRLVGRMEILSKLLREAKIPIPQAQKWKEFKQKNRKWSGKINKEKDSVLKEKMERRNENDRKEGNSHNDKATLLSNTPKIKSNPTSLVPKHRKNIVSKVKNELGTKQKPLQPTTSNCLIIYTQAYNTPSCYLVNSTPSTNLAGSSKTVITNSLVASNPVMATNVKGNKRALKDSNSKVPTLGTGTLILTNGNIYPVLPQSQPIISTSMVLRVANQTSESDSVKTKNDENIDQKIPKKIFKKSLNKPPHNNITNPCCKTSISEFCMGSKVSNIFPCESNLVLCKNSPAISAPVGMVPILPAPNVSKPKVPLVATNNRRIKGRRIGDRPVSRQALKRIRKMNKKIGSEDFTKKLKMENSSTNILDNKHEKLLKKDLFKEVNSKSAVSTCSEEMKSVEKMKVDAAKDFPNSTSTVSQIGLSIIADSVVKSSEQNAIFEMNSKMTTHDMEESSVENCEHNNSISKNEISCTPELHSSKAGGSKNSMKQNSESGKSSINTSNMSTIDLKIAEPSASNSVPDNETQLKKITNTSQKEKISENSQKNREESNTDVLKSNQTSSDLQNMRSEGNLDLDNVCCMNQQLKHLDIHLGHSELSNDIFASLQVPSGCQNPESTSPTAAFLLAFPLVSSLTGVKVTEVMEEDNTESQRETPTLLQIGTMDTTKTTQSESFAPNLLNLDFFSSKDVYGGFYNSFEQHLSHLTMMPSSGINESSKVVVKNTSSKFGDNFRTSSLIDNIQTASASKLDSRNTQSSTSPMVTNSGVQNNSGIPSDDINCQPNFSFENKQSNSVTASGEITNRIPPSVFYSDKPVIQSNPDKDANVTDSQSVDMAKSTNIIEKVSVQNLQSNIQPTKDNIESNIISSNKNSKGKVPNSFTKKDTCQNIFTVGNINLEPKSIVQLNMNFYPEKQRSAINKDFDLQNSISRDVNMQGLFRENTHDAQLPLTSDRNFMNSSMQSNDLNTSFGIDNITFESKNMNVKSYNHHSQQVDSSQKAVIHPYFIPDNKNYSLSNQNNSKTSNDDNRITETQKYFTYNNFNSENKKSLKTSEVNISFNIDNKIVPVPKMVESKQITPNYNMNYSNMTYDLPNITKVCTCAYSSSKPISEPVYTNSNNNNYNYFSNCETYLHETCYKNVKNDKNHVAPDLENYGNYKKSDFNSTYYSDNLRKNNITAAKSENTQEKSTYNWMTAPMKTTSEHIIPSFSKDDMIYSNANLVNSNQTNFFNPTSMYSNDLNTNLSQTPKKTFDLPLVNMSYQKPEVEEGQNQFTWSPTKMPQFLDPVPSFVSSTLPTLVGDLALGSSNFNEQKYEFSNKGSKETKNKTTKMSYENQNSLFSVSQLVHQNDKTVPAKSVRRRNSGSVSKHNQTKNKKIVKNNEENKEVPQCFNKTSGSQSHAKMENKNFNFRQTNSNTFFDKGGPLKVSSSIYSAESLIGHQGHTEHNSKKDQTFPGNPMKNIPVPPYMPDNIMPYFPPVDLQQDNIIQQNQNYQNFPNFTTFSNNSYSSNTFIPSSTITTPYITSSTFVSDIGVGNEFSSENLFPNTTMNKIKMGPRNNAGHREEKNIQNNHCTNIVMKKKRKTANEMNVTTSLVDFSFLSAPGRINSPLLPDDFHSHSTFLPPPSTQPQLYPCKNTLYPPKQSTLTSSSSLLPLPPIPSVTRSVIHPEISPSLNSAGTSLTNFNLSTIFPEINKSSMTDIYSDNQAKESSADRHYPHSSVSFNSKSTFTYPNGPITQPYGIDNR